MWWYHNKNLIMPDLFKDLFFTIDILNLYEYMDLCGKTEFDVYQKRYFCAKNRILCNNNLPLFGLNIRFLCPKNPSVLLRQTATDSLQIMQQTLGKFFKYFWKWQKTTNILELKHHHSPHPGGEMLNLNLILCLFFAADVSIFKRQ